MSSDRTSRTDPAVFVRADVRRRRAYSLDLSPCRHKLDQNEMPWELPPPVRRLAADALARARWARYPDFHGDEVRRRLSALHDWPVEGILVGNGSNELLDVVIDAVVEPGTTVLGVAPSFGLYGAMVSRAHGVYRPLAPDPALVLPAAALEAEITARPESPLILCSPNNPTGAAWTIGELGRFASRLRAPLLLDAAYAEFGHEDYRPLLDRHQNVVIFRTLSKAWSLGGIRIGFLLAAPSLVAELIKVKLPYNVGRAGLALAAAALDSTPAVRRRIAAVVGRRPQWAEMLASHGFEVVDSEANFLLARCSGHSNPATRAGEIFEGLAARGIRVRDVGHYPGLAGCLRISVGSGAALRAVDEALTEIGGVVP